MPQLPSMPIMQGSPALEALRRLGRRPTRSPLEGPEGMSENVYQSQPDLGIPFIAGPGENQAGLDFIHNKLQSPQADAQRAEVQDYRNKELGAILSGFQSGAQQGNQYLNPIQAQATAGRAMEEEKIRMPLRVAERSAEIGAQGGLAQQREQSRGALDVARENQRGMADRAQSMMELYSLLGAGGGNARGITIPGAGSITAGRPEARVPQAALSQVTAARQQLERARNASFGDPSQAEAVYRQALGAVYGQDPATPELKELAAAIALNPETSNLPLSQILNEFDFEGANVNLADPVTQRDLDRLLNYSRGIVGGQ